MDNNSKHILYAEDDKDLREMVVEYLGGKFPNIPIEFFEDGLALKKRLENSLDGIAVVVTDNEMPGIQGSQIIREYASRTNFPFILAYGGETKIGEEAVKDGAYSYVLKGQMYLELIKHLNVILSESTQSSQ